MPCHKCLVVFYMWVYVPNDGDLKIRQASCETLWNVEIIKNFRFKYKQREEIYFVCCFF